MTASSSPRAIAEPDNRRVATELEDLTGLFDLAERRLAERMRGLTDDEWSWRPTPAGRRVAVDPTG